MEPRLGYDFGHVRIHNDERAGESARSVGAFAYTVGNHVVLDRAWYAPHTPKGLHLLAHELAHVVQQRPGGARQVPDRIGRANDSAEREAEYVADAVVGASGGAGADVRTTTGAPADRHATLRRLTRTALVTCPVGQNPHGADRRASKFLEDAINLIGRAQAARPANPADPDVVAVGNALRVAFRLDPASAATWTAGAPQIRLPVITRRLQMAKNYIDSVVFTVTCRGAGGSHVIPGCAVETCSPGTEAFSCPSNPREIVLCPPFWAHGANQRARTWAHEVFHINFQAIDDWGQPDVRNAHCYSQFVALLNGFNSPRGFRCH